MPEKNKFPDIRRQDRVMDNSRAIELLENSLYGFLCLGENKAGYTYGIPISYAYDKKENCIYFHSAPEGEKLEILKQHNKVSFCIVDNVVTISFKFTTQYESVIVFGSIDINPTDEDKRVAFRKLVEKYSPGYMEAGEAYMEKSFHRACTFKLMIEHITGKSNKF